MSAESEINTALNASEDVTEIVGSGADARIYPDFRAQEIVLPAIVYQRDETEYVTTIHDGAVHATMVTIEIWCMATTRIGAEELADVAEASLADTNFRPVERRPEYDPENLTFATVISCSGWPA